MAAVGVWRGRSSVASRVLLVRLHGHLSDSLGVARPLARSPAALPAPAHLAPSVTASSPFSSLDTVCLLFTLAPTSSGAAGPHAPHWLSGSVRHFSGGKDTAPDSDDDFKPQYRKPEEATPIHKLIEEDVKSNPVMVYMKGTPSMPMCGFSGGVVQILKAYGVEFKSRNVLEDAELRQGIKTFSQWPTIPQIFVNGEFVGGCDILFKMHEDGELEGLFAKLKTPTAN